jgi:membrane protease YdiL (CAAX protease family)
MSSITTFCPSCGQALEPEQGDLCPQCAVTSHPPPPPLSEAGSKWLDLFWAFVVWGVSGGFMLMLDLAIRVGYWLTKGGLPDLQVTKGVVIISLAFTLIMHVAGFVAAWMFVTRLGRRPFWQSLGWGWHPQFKMVHAVGLAFLMIGVGGALEEILPHTETDLERFLKMGILARIMVAALAVMTAPLIEEIVYRGVVYSSVERLIGRGAAVFFVTLLFTAVHVPQYWGSVAAITAIVSLSFVLTLTRAWTGKLLPCVVIHLVYNVVQAIALLLAPEDTTNNPQNQAALIFLSGALGLDF